MATQLLLADDSATIAKILGMALQSEPYEIRSVLTAEDALRELKANPPAIFLVDLSLPEKNGYDFARLIKADSHLRSIRVVLLASAFEPVDERIFPFDIARIAGSPHLVITVIEHFGGLAGAVDHLD